MAKARAVGAWALASNTTGIYNDAFGEYALFNSTASYNAAFGTYAMDLDTTGSGNAAFGFSALYSNTTGIENASFGYDALDQNATFHPAAFSRTSMISFRVADSVDILCSPI